MKNLLTGSEKNRIKNFGLIPDAWPTVNPDTPLTPAELLKIARDMPLTSGEFGTFLMVLGYATYRKEKES